MSQRTILPELETKLLLYQKERGFSWLLQNSWCWPDPRGNVIILCSCSCPVRSGHCVPANSHQGKCYFLFSSLLSVSEWKVLWLKGQAWEAEPWEKAIMYMLSYRERSFTVWLDKVADPAWLSTGKGALRLELVIYSSPLIMDFGAKLPGFKFWLCSYWLSDLQKINQYFCAYQ